ncbi:U24-ctenitoxin-Pn1a-like isoform X2 [Uloborus diversus]|nr:U24-ctenitoxin-Pn1a-like isoform X2 [Uloborus diversus]
MRSFCILVVTFCLAGIALALTECEEHRQREQQSNTKVKLVPECDENGDYKPLQCFQGSPFCMCWRKDGSHITEPSRKLKSCGCIVHRDEAVSRHLIGNYHPQCEEDGTYSRTQCHGSVGYCWCVDEHGNKVNKSLNDC